MATKLRSIA